MAQIQKGTTYITGDQVTAANLNALADSAILLAGAITDQTAKTVPLAADTLLIHSAADTALRKSTLTQLFANATGIPISTGISGLGSGVATFLGTPSSANLAAAVTDETGSGSLVFATSPTLVTPILGTPQSGTLTSCTGLPISTGVSGLGTGVATALAVNVGSAGAPVLFNGALGTPTSGTVTNLTGTASININGTVGATTPSTVAATTGVFSGLLSANKNSATQFQATGWNAVSGANAQNGQIDIGTTAVGLRLIGDAAGSGTAYIDSTWDNVGSAISFRLRGSGTPVVGAVMTTTGLNSTAIGATTPSTVAATTITANTSAIITGGAAIGQPAFQATGNQAGQLIANLTSNISGAGTSFGLRVAAGTNASDYALRVLNQAGTLDYLFVKGDGAVSMSNGLAVTGALSSTGNVTLGGGSDLFNGSVRISDSASSTAPAYFQSGEPGISGSNVILSNNYFGTSGGASGRKNTSVGASYLRLNVGAASTSTATLGFISASGTLTDVLAVNSAGAAVTGALSATGNVSGGILTSTVSGTEVDFVLGNNTAGRRVEIGTNSGGHGVLKLRNASNVETITANAGTGLAVTGALSSTGALAIGNTVATAVAVASTHKVTIVIGGVTYYLLATNV